MTTVTGTATQDFLTSVSRKTSSEKAEQGSQMQFLTLLTTQLKNQDPMNPMENAEMTSQLAQISTVDGIEKLNKQLATLLDGQQSGDAVQAAALVGRGVLVPGKGLNLTEAGALGGFTLDGPADKVTVNIKDANGLDVAKVDLGEFAAGTHNFQWDGTAISGERAANGRYTVSLTAVRGEDKVTTEALELGAVTSVVRGAKSTDLQVGELGIFKLSDIKQIL